MYAVILSEMQFFTTVLFTILELDIPGSDPGHIACQLCDHEQVTQLAY